MSPKLHPGPKLPAPLADRAAQLERAKSLAEKHIHSTVRSASHSSEQGSWSQTIVLAFESDTKPGVIQFRIEKLDAAPYIEARKHLGDIVPAVERWEDEELETAGIWCYYMSLVEGRTWWEVDDELSLAQRLASAKSLGAAIAKGLIIGDDDSCQQPSRAVVEKVVRPRFEAVVKCELDDVVPARPLVQEMLGQLHKLWRLPLSVTHNDFRPMNIMLSEDRRSVSGLIDWEYSDPLFKPFGFAMYAFHYISGRYNADGVFERNTGFDDINRAFWQGIAQAATPDVKALLHNEPELIEFAVRVGTVFDVFALDDDDGKIHFHDLAARSIPTFMAWTLPELEGSPDW